MVTTRSFVVSPNSPRTPRLVRFRNLRGVQVAAHDARPKHDATFSRQPGLQELPRIIVVLEDRLARKSTGRPLQCFENLSGQTDVPTITPVQRAQSRDRIDDDRDACAVGCPASPHSRLGVERMHDLRPQGSKIARQMRNRIQIQDRVDTPRHRIKVIIVATHSKRLCKAGSEPSALTSNRSERRCIRSIRASTSGPPTSTTRGRHASDSSPWLPKLYQPH